MWVIRWDAKNPNELHLVLIIIHLFLQHLSVYTLEDGAHYLNINLQTPEGINLARTAGLGQSGVADVILTRYIFNAADLFRDTGKCVCDDPWCFASVYVSLTSCNGYVSWLTGRSHRKMFYFYQASHWKNYFFVSCIEKKQCPRSEGDVVRCLCSQRSRRGQLDD